MKNSLEILDKKNETLQRMKKIVDTCRVEMREMSEEEAKEFELAKQEIEMLKKELSDLKEKLAKYDDDLNEVDNEVVPQDNTNTNSETNNRNLNTKIMKEFRLLKAINDIANNRTLDENSQEVVSRGINEMKKAGISYTGQIQIPVESRASITVTGTSNGTVDVDTMSMLEALRGRNILAQAGAKFLTGLVGDVQVPVLTGAQVSWEGETDATADGNASIKSVKLQPKRLSCFVDISKQFLVQDSADAEAALRQDLINAINAKLEQTILGTGAGSTTEPKGIFSASDGVVDTFEKLVNLEATIDGTNILGNPKYILSNEAKAKFRVTPKIAVTGSGSGASATAIASGAIYTSGEIDGIEAFNSSNVVANYFAYGDFSNLAIGQWGSIDLVVDPYTKAAEGMIRLVVNAYFDMKVLREKAIAVGKIK